MKAGSGSGLDQYDAAIFAASCDDPETNERYARSLRLDYPILSDPGQETARAYGVVTSERKLPFRWTFYIGKDGRILYIEKEVAAATHGEQVAERLRRLGVERRDRER